MSRIAIRVQIGTGVKPFHWPQLKALITDGVASTVGHQQYEFYTHGDAIGFQLTCDELGIKYKVDDLSDD